MLLTTSAVGTDPRLSFSTGGAAAQVTILTGGNVGIGTAGPTQALTIGDSKNIQLGVNDGVGGSLFFRRINSQTDPTVPINGAGIYYNWDPSNNEQLSFNLAGSERMVVNSGGNVGIGTASPNNKLEVYGPAGTNPYVRITKNGFAQTGGVEFYNGVSKFGSIYMGGSGGITISSESGYPLTLPYTYCGSNMDLRGAISNAVGNLNLNDNVDISGKIKFDRSTIGTYTVNRNSNGTTEINLGSAGQYSFCALTRVDNIGGDHECAVRLSVNQWILKVYLWNGTYIGCTAQCF